IPILIDNIAAIRRKGVKVLLVTSGAVGTGMKALGLEKRPQNLAAVQALAALGQNKLMAIYEQECARHNFKCAQLLLTAADLRKKSRNYIVLTSNNPLWEYYFRPINNQHDSVSVDELKFGDNDLLAGMLASMTNTELTIILTTQPGMRERNADGSLGERISLIRKITPEIRAAAGGTDSSDFSIGGMSSKIRSAAVVNASGHALWIADGREDDVLAQIFQAEDVGTLFLPSKRSMHSKKRWIGFFAKSAGVIQVDDGAARAVLLNGKSLLPSGVKAVRGKFRRGDTLDIVDLNDKIIGRGITNYSSDECQKIMGLHGSELPAALGYIAEDEIIHRDNLAVDEAISNN
ncbi:MAG: glutamate 5-kinase, partial [Victivallaceae bacterium]